MMKRKYVKPLCHMHKLEPMQFFADSIAERTSIQKGGGDTGDHESTEVKPTMDDSGSIWGE